MALFDYQAVDREGKKVKGRLDASNLKLAKQSLQGQGLIILAVKAHQEKSSGLKGKKSKVSLSAKGIADFTRQFALLQSTSIPYDRALDILISENKDPDFLQVLSEIKAKVEEGGTFAQALAPFERQFSLMYLAMVKAGEAGGSLPKVLTKLAEYLEESQELKNKLQAALIYPIVMSVMGLGIVVFMMTFILPKIIPLFQQFDLALPLPTQIVIFCSGILTSGWWAFLLGGVLLFLGGRQYLRSDGGRLRFDQLILRVPVIKVTLTQIYNYRFTQTLATLMASGVEVKEAFGIVAQVTGSRVYEEKFGQIIQDITQKGLDISQALRKTGLFSPSVLQMIRVGEETSHLEEMLEQIAKNMEKEVKDQVQKAVALLEPLLIVLMALMVGFIVLAVMLPMFELNTLV